MTAPLSLTTGGSLYDRIGPEALAELVSRFYDFVAREPLLTPIFPADLTLTAEKQLAFLSGFLGGPPLYHERFGHPRLRARHLPFPITPARAGVAGLHAGRAGRHARDQCGRRAGVVHGAVAGGGAHGEHASAGGCGGRLTGGFRNSAGGRNLDNSLHLTSRVRARSWTRFLHCAA